MAKTIKITSSNEISVVDVDFDDYRAIQKVVGGMFETVKTQRMFDYFGKPVMMLVDEEGILKQLPLNRTGSRFYGCLLYTSPSPRDGLLSRMPSSA